MVETITPVGHGGSRSRWAVSLALHALGAVAAAAVLGAALGLLGRVLGAPWPAGWLLVALAAGAYALREGGAPVPLPERRRQVPEWWRSSFPAAAAALLYGVGLGAGVFTHLRHGTLLVVGLAAAAGGDAALGALILAPFGLARAGALALAWRSTSPERVSRVVHALERIAASSAPRAANGVALLAVAIWAGTHAGTRGAAEAGAAIIAIAFAWAALAKARGPARWRNALSDYRLGALEGPAAVAVPALEAAVPSLVAAALAPVAGGVALVLLVGFSAALLRARATAGDRLPCGCFGAATRLDWRLLLARNAALVVASLAATGAGAQTHLRMPTGEEWLPAGLAGAGVLAATLTVALALRSIRPVPRDGSEARSRLAGEGWRP